MKSQKFFMCLKTTLALLVHAGSPTPYQDDHMLVHGVKLKVALKAIGNLLKITYAIQFVILVYFTGHLIFIWI